MEMNQMTIGTIVLIAVLIIFFLIRKNQKDKKDFERDMTRSEIKPEQHSKDETL